VPECVELEKKKNLAKTLPIFGYLEGIMEWFRHFVEVEKIKYHLRFLDD